MQKIVNLSEGNIFHWNAVVYLNIIIPQYKFVETIFIVFYKQTSLYSVSTKSLRGFEKLWRANKLS
jgi:hypothetical protein